MFQQSPLPIRQEELPVTQSVLSNNSINVPRICVSDSDENIPIQPFQPVEVNYQTESKLNLDSNFLIICITLLLALLAVVGFIGYWVLTKHNHSNSNANKRREIFLTIFLYGFGILTAIVIFFLFYLIIYH